MVPTTMLCCTVQHRKRCPTYCNREALLSALTLWVTRLLRNTIEALTWIAGEAAAQKEPSTLNRDARIQGAH